ncbi:MAG: CapA family protein [Bacteroidota bacterium]|nr:CapA family protein [Bacteroidota bacterium]
MPIKISFTGDIMSLMPQNKASRRRNNTYDYDRVFCFVKRLFNDADYVVGNLETPIAGEELGYTKEPTVFNTPCEFASSAFCAGINCFTLANNHILDRGVEGLNNTVKNLDIIGADHTGAYTSLIESQEVLIKEIKGVRIAFLSYTYGTNSEWQNNVLTEETDYCVDLFRKQDAFLGISERPVIKLIKRLIKKLLPQFLREKIRPIVSEDGVGTIEPAQGDMLYIHRLREKIKKAKNNSDYVIMCMHSGGQYNSEIGPYTRDLAHRLIDYGCDLVIGNHPHCVLEYERYRDQLIIYSLGNFCFTPNWGFYYNGVYADYSLVLNTYFEKKQNSVKLSKVTVTPIKCVREKDGNSVVYPISLLYGSLPTKKRQKMISDVYCVLERFLRSGKVGTMNVLNNEIDVTCYLNQ